MWLILKVRLTIISEFDLKNKKRAVYTNHHVHIIARSFCERCTLCSETFYGVLGAIFGGRGRPSSLNSSKARAGNGVLAFCFASVPLFIREERNRHGIIIGKL